MPFVLHFAFLTFNFVFLNLPFYFCLPSVLQLTRFTERARRRQSARPSLQVLAVHTRRVKSLWKNIQTAFLLTSRVTRWFPSAMSSSFLSPKSLSRSVAQAPCARSKRRWPR